MQGQFIATNIIILYSDIKQVMRTRKGWVEC